MILKVQNLIWKSFSKIGVTDNGVVTDAQMMNDAFIDLNIMLDELAADTLFCMGSVMVDFPLTAGKASYTIGTGGDFNTSMPLKITDAFIRDSADVDYPLNIISESEWADIQTKSIIQSVPGALWYSLGAPQQASFLGTINLVPIPAEAYTLYFGEQNAITEFAGLTSTVTFLPVYYAFLMWNLAARLLPDYPTANELQVKLILLQADETMKRLEMLNAQEIVSPMTSPGRRPGYWDINSGHYV